LAISRKLLMRKEAELRKQLEKIDFGHGRISVQGSNGLAFVVNR
jgi:hypothetical protein